MNREMLGKLHFYSYNNFSTGLRLLQEAVMDQSGFNIPIIRHNKSNYRGAVNKCIINWGASDIPNDEIHKSNVFNQPAILKTVTNKLTFLRHIGKAMEQGHRIPRCIPFTDNQQVAQTWLINGSTVVARNLLTGHSGEGIVIVKPGDNLPACPLYTLYVPKKEEYRVHFWGQNIIDTQKKLLKKKDAAGKDVDPALVNWNVRNLANGFVYARDNLVVPPDVTLQARRYIDLSKHHFGAIDLIFHERTQQAYILEVNTAPGLQGTTAERYADAIIKDFGL